VAIDLQSGQVTPLIENPTVLVRYAAGYLIYVRNDATLQAAPFDPERSRLTGPAVTLAQDIGATGQAEAHVAVSGNGTLIYAPEEPRSLVLLDRNGAPRLATESLASFHAPSFSPDGKRLALDLVNEDGRDVWVLDLSQGTMERVTFDRGHDATWTPDGRHLTYTTFKSGALGVYRVRPGSNAPAESLMASLSFNHTGLWLPDGSALLTVASELTPGSMQDIALVKNAGRGPIEPVVATKFRENYPSLSPDGRWMAFVSDQTGDTRVYARPLTGEGDQVQVSQGTATEPVWSRDGAEIFYRSVSGDRAELIAARVEMTPAFRVVSRQALFSVGEYLNSTPHANYDVSPDGKSFVMVRRNASSRIVVIQNFPELARRLGGAARSR
jgi:Tol biopolymer transport system component